MARQAVIRYDIKHAVFNDIDFKFWNSQGVNSWPTMMVVGPHRKPLLQLSGEAVKDKLEAFLHAAIDHFSGKCNTDPLPLAYEKDK